MDFRNFSTTVKSYGISRSLDTETLESNQIYKGDLILNVNFDTTDLKNDINPNS